jgi:hypothetical protein
LIPMGAVGRRPWLFVFSYSLQCCCELPTAKG